jgi:hypothetical protein
VCAGNQVLFSKPSQELLLLRDVSLPIYYPTVGIEFLFCFSPKLKKKKGDAAVGGGSAGNGVGPIRVNTIISLGPL